MKMKQQMIRLSIVSLWWILSTCLIDIAVGKEGEGLYETLGIEKDADNRAIRRAYKKLAMFYHPDKNKEEGAHERFVKINRAYEVLKDEDMRKKYDQFGEDSLKDDFVPPGGHPTWQFFQTFGIYDEDKEIQTLSRNDFHKVSAGGGTWFVNFYSTHCSHCHQLAPTWRKMAIELEGVIQIGAVNCAEDVMLCQEQGVHGYPALILYNGGNQPVMYQNARDKEMLVEFVMSQLAVTVHEVKTRNLKALTEEWDQFSKLPWLIEFHDNSNTGLSALSRKKLSSMLEGLCNVGTVNCAIEDDLCGEIGIERSVAYFPPGKITKSESKILDSLDVRELNEKVLSLLPELPAIDSVETLKALSEGDESESWLIQFVSGNSDDQLEYRKLPSLITKVKIGRFDCSPAENDQLCKALFIVKTPAFALFKASGGYEIHHGGQTVGDIVSFVQTSVESPLRIVTGQEDFDTITSDSSKPWMLDFFAPWCPPCMRLLPEMRAAARLSNGTVNFATVDCTQHQNLCLAANVNSYPTTVLYNGTALPPNPFIGLHTAAELLDFIDDVANPPVIVLDPSSFRSRVEGRKGDETWVVDFFAPWCGPCQQLAPEWRKLAKTVDDLGVVRVASVDCDAHRPLCQAQNVVNYPTIRLYPADRSKSTQMYQSFYRDAGNLRLWVSQMLPSQVEHITNEEFYNRVLTDSEPWLLDFYAPWCGPCQLFGVEFEILAKMFRGRVNLAKVNCDENQGLCQAANIQVYPSVRLYVGVQAGEEGGNESQDPMGTLSISSQSAADISPVLEQTLADLAAKKEGKNHDHSGSDRVEL